MINRNCLDKEIEVIQDAQIRKFVKDTIENAPERFFVIPASSTKKWHPECTNIEGGLIIHVKRVVYICERLVTAWNFDASLRDIAIAACILHDLAKCGRDSGAYEDYVNHPINAEKFFVKNGLDDEIYNKIRDAVRYHMGLWTPNSIKKPLGKYTPVELIVYTSDYLASTKDMSTPKDLMYKVQE